jgi:hypothetical protein
LKLNVTRYKEETHVFVAQVQEFLKLNSTVRECAEGTLLLEVSGDLGVGYRGVSL